MVTVKHCTQTVTAVHISEGKGCGGVGGGGSSRWNMRMVNVCHCQSPQVTVKEFWQCSTTQQTSFRGWGKSQYWNMKMTVNWSFCLFSCFLSSWHVFLSHYICQLNGEHEEKNHVPWLSVSNFFHAYSSNPSMNIVWNTVFLLKPKGLHLKGANFQSTLSIKSSTALCEKRPYFKMTYT